MAGRWAAAVGRSGSGLAGWRLVAVLLRPGAVLFALAGVLGAVSAVLAFGPYLAVWLMAVDLVEGDIDSGRFLTIAAAAAVAVGLRHGLFAVSTTIAHTAAFRMQVNLRTTLVAHLFRVPPGSLEAMGEGELRTVVVDDVLSLEDAVAHLIPETSAFATGFLALMAVMITLDPRLAIVAFLPVFLAVAVLVRTRRRAAGATAEYRQVWSDLSGMSAQIARSGAVLKLYDSRRQTSGRLEDLCRRFIDTVERWVRLCLVPTTLFIVLIGGSLAFCLPAALLLASAGGASTATALFFIVFSFCLGDYFCRLNELGLRLSRQREVLGRIGAMLSLPELRPIATEPVSLPGSDLVFERVCFSYGDKRVITNIDLTLPEGSVTALVGPSGSGKSTLARLAIRAFDGESGCVRLGGVDIRTIPPNQFSQVVATVFQDTILVRGTIRDNIAMGKTGATDDEIGKAAADACVDEFVARLPDGYDTVLTEDGEGLSLGQRQRIGIARAFLRGARLLVLDEATAFADPETESLVQKALSRLMEGRTVLVVAHRLQTIVNADQIAVVSEGRIVERGRHRDLLWCDGLYARLWRDQQPGAEAAA